MEMHQIYAMIADEEVKQVSLFDNYEEANRVTRAVYGEDALAVCCNQYFCGIGDKYMDGVFYKVDGVTPIPYIPTQEQQVSQLQAENQQLKADSQDITLALADMIGGAENAQ